MLADRLAVDQVNCAWPGESNMRILWKIREMKYAPDDLVIIQWSFQDRDTILDDTQEIIGPWAASRIAKHYFLAHNEEDMENRNILCVEHAALWLERHNVRWMFFSNIGFRGNYRHFANRLILDYMGEYTINDDRAADGIHFGVRSNERWADRVHECVQSYLADPSFQPRP